MFFQCLYLDLLTLLPDNSQNVFLIYLDHYLTIHTMFALEKFETEMWNTMAHIWDIITYKICKMMFLDVAITFVKEKLQLNSNSILYLMKHVLCVCVCVCMHEYVGIYLNYQKTGWLFKLTDKGSHWWNYGSLSFCFWLTVFISHYNSHIDCLLIL